jgi:hypothetical protein
MSLLPNLDQMTDNEKLAVLESIQKSIAESKEIQKKKIGENVDLVVQALKKIESDIRDRFDAVGNSIEKRVLSIKDGRNGADGKDGRDGKDGKSGKDGLKGDRGVNGQAGRDGVDGVDGVSVVNANIDFDGSLVITLSDGRELNVGEVVSQDIAEKIKVISTMSTNAAIAVKEEGTTLTNGVKSINFVGTGITATTSGDDVTVTVAGGGGSGTVTSVAATAGTGISITGSPITTSGTLNITNTAPDQTVVLTAGTGINTSGTYPSFTVTNSAPDQTVALTQGGTTTITGTYPNFTISSADQFQGTVTSVTGTSPVVSSGGATPAISLAASYGDTQNPYASKTANFVLAAPNGSAGAPTFRAIVAADIPTLNQNTTGSAASLSATLVATSGGTGQSSYAIGDLLYASTTTALSKLADVATGNALISGGVSVAPSWGKIALTTHVSGTLPVANGGTGLTSIPHTVQVFTSSSGTYTTPANCKAISVRMVGGGGGGAGTGTSATAGTAGGSTTFGTAFLTCTGGAGGFVTGTNQAGGTATGGDINIAGATAPGAVGGVTNFTGGVGGSTPFGGAGAGGCANATGSTAATNSGAGGGGGGGGTSTLTGGGGAAGAYLEKLISSPSATYAYAIGAAGTNGTGGTSNGGGGGSGLIIVTEYYV